MQKVNYSKRQGNREVEQFNNEQREPVRLNRFVIITMSAIINNKIVSCSCNYRTKSLAMKCFADAFVTFLNTSKGLSLKTEDFVNTETSRIDFEKVNKVASENNVTFNINDLKFVTANNALERTHIEFDINKQLNKFKVVHN